MKKYYLFFIICLSVFVCFLSGCKERDLDTGKITTSKAGNISFSLYSNDDINKKAELTPLVGVEKENILDDGKGLYSVKITKVGEGEVSLDQESYEEGSTVNINVRPAVNYKLVNIFLNNLPIESTSFVMPSKDSEIVVIFADMHHNIYTDGPIVLDDNNFQTVEGQRSYFTVDLVGLGNDSYYYYLPEDVKCYTRPTSYEEERVEIEIKNEGNDRFSFIAPDKDVDIKVSLREKVYLQGVYGFLFNNNDYEYIDNYTDYVNVSFSMNDDAVLVNQYYLQDKLIINVDYLNPLYVIDKIQLYVNYNNYKDATKIDDTHYEIDKMFSGYIYVLLKENESVHQIYCDDSEFGEISVDKKIASVNEEVEVTVSPEDEYRLYKLGYTVNDTYYEIKEQDGKYIFKVPNSDVHLQAEFESIYIIRGRVEVRKTSTDEALKFTDVVTAAFLFVEEKDYFELSDDMIIALDSRIRNVIYFTCNWPYSFDPAKLNGEGILCGISGNQINVDIVNNPGDGFIITLYVK